MKNILPIMFLAAFIASLSFAFAYPVLLQLNGNVPFNSKVYSCTDSTCSDVSYYTTPAGTPLSYLINNTGSGIKYFAEYDYVADRCYVSHSYTNFFNEQTLNGPWQYDVEFAKQAGCKSLIDSIDYENILFDNESQEVMVSVRSPFELNPEGPQTIPYELEYYYSTHTHVTIKIKDADNDLLAEEIQEEDILWGTNEDFWFLFEGLTEGIYTIEISTDVDDCMCSSSHKKMATRTFTIINSSQGGNGGNNNNTNNTNQTNNQTNQSNTAPIADFSFFPLIANVSQIVNFDGSASSDSDGNIVNYSWNFGDAGTASGIMAIHSYSLPGNYSVMLTIADDDNAMNSMTKIIQIVNASPSNNNTNNTGGNNNNTNNTNQSNGGGSSSSGSGSFNKGNVENIIARTFMLENQICGKQSDVTLELYNEDSGRINEVKAVFEIKELGIKEESGFFDLTGRDSEWQFLSVNWPKVQGSYYAKIRLTSHNDIYDIIKKIDIVCPNANAIAFTSSDAASAQSTGITGNVIASQTGSSSLLTFLLVIILIAIVAVVIKLMTIYF